MKYYVLGKKDNKMLHEYLDKYHQVLRKKLDELVENNFCVQECSYLLKNADKSTIVHPDFSSLINLFHNSIIKNQTAPVDENIYLEIFKREVGYLMDNDFEKLSINKGEKIGNTNIGLSLDFINPYDGLDAHPDHHKTGGIVGFGEKDQKQWLDVYKKTFNLLQSVDEGFYDELNFIISKIVPLGTARGLHNSASYKETVGTLYLGYTIDTHTPEINNLEAIIHESSHNKLNLLMQFDPIILNDSEEKYYSPYRPDARHIHGTFLGLHAFVPTIYILAKSYVEKKFICDGMWREKILLYHMKNQICLNVIKKYAQLTDLGGEVLNEIIEVIEMTKPLIKEINYSPEEVAFIKQEFKNHFQSVNINYPYLEY